MSEGASCLESVAHSQLAQDFAHFALSILGQGLQAGSSQKNRITEKVAKSLAGPHLINRKDGGHELGADGRAGD